MRTESVEARLASRLECHDPVDARGTAAGRGQMHRCRARLTGRDMRPACADRKRVRVVRAYWPYDFHAGLRPGRRFMNLNRSVQMKGGVPLTSHPAARTTRWSGPLPTMTSRAVTAVPRRTCQRPSGCPNKPFHRPRWCISAAAGSGDRQGQLSDAGAVLRRSRRGL